MSVRVCRPCREGRHTECDERWLSAQFDGLEYCECLLCEKVEQDVRQDTDKKEKEET